MTRRSVRRFGTGAAMAAFAAGIFSAALRKKNRGKFLVAVSGGRTPARLLKKLSKLSLPWERVIFFMADERLVPVSSPDSNFGAARRALFSRIKIPAANLRPVENGAGAYEKELLKETGGSGRLDLVFLGLGEDGHTASLFPGSPALEERGRFVRAARAPRGVRPEGRVTLTLKTLDRAGAVLLMAAGPEKKKIFEKAARGDRGIPAGRLRPRGRLHLLYSERE